MIRTAKELNRIAMVTSMVMISVDESPIFNHLLPYYQVVLKLDNTRSYLFKPIARNVFSLSLNSKIKEKVIIL